MKAKNIMLEMRTTNYHHAPRNSDNSIGLLLPRVEIAPFAGCPKTAARQPLKVSKWVEAYFTPEIRFQQSTTNKPNHMKRNASTQFVIHQNTSKTIALAIMLTILATVFLPNAKADSGVKYSRNYLRQEQGLVLRCITDADRDCDAASRFLDAGLGPEAGDELVQTLFNLDTADLKMEGELDRIAQLESRPFTYSKTDEQVKMSAECADLRDQIQNDSARAATLSQRCIQGQTSSALKVYIAKRESYRNRIRNGLSESNIALDECRQLAVFPLALVANGLVNVENMAHCRVATDGTVTLPNGQVLHADGQPKIESTAAQHVGTDELAALKKQSSELQSQMSRLQEDAKHSPRPRPVINTLVIIVTNEVRTVVEKTNIIQSTTPLLPMLTGAVSNAPVANLAQTPASSLANSNIGVGTTLNSPKPPLEIKKPESDNFKAENLQPALGQNYNAFKQTGTPSTTTLTDVDPPAESHDSKKSHSTDFVLKLVVFAGGFMLLVTVVSFTALSSAHHRPVKLTLTDDNTGNVHEIALMNANEIVVLDEDPHSAPNVGQNDAVILRRNWLGNVLLHPYEGLHLNGTPISRTRRLHVGDRIAVPNNSGIKTFVFGGTNSFLTNMIESQPEIAV